MRPDRTTPRRRSLRGALAAVLSALLIVTGLSTAPAAMAVSDDISQFSFSTTMADGATVTAGQTFTAKLQYPAKVDGQTYTVQVPDGITVPTLTSDNSALASITASEGTPKTLTFTFTKNSSNPQGYYEFDFTVGGTTESTVNTPFTWLVNGEEQTTTVTLLRNGDKVSDVTTNKVTKTANNGTLGNAIVVSDDGIVSLNTAAANKATFTVTIDAKDARPGLQISDAITSVDNAFDFIPGAITGTLTTWDENGLNREQNTSFAVGTATADGITGTVDLPAGSRLSFTYSVKLTDDADAIAALTEKLQAAYDAAKAGTSGANIGFSFTNDVTLSDSTHASKTVTINKWIAGKPAPVGPSFSGNFNKSASITSDTQIELAEDGTTLVTPVDVVYTLKANMAAFTNADETLTYDRNVVLTDNLTANQAWSTSDADFFTTTGGTFTAAAEGTTEADFAGDDFIGTYLVIGNKLLINIGQDKDANYTFAVKAKILTVTGLTSTKNPSDNPIAAERWGIANTLTVTYRTGQNAANVGTSTVNVFVAKGTDEPITSSDVFKKSGPTKEVTLGDDGIARLPFTFALGTKNTYPIGEATIVDVVDHSAFNVTEDNLDAIKETLTGTAAWWVNLTGDDFDVVLNEDGNLEFTLTEQWITDHPTEAASAVLTFTVTLPTVALQGKATLDYTNSGYMTGSGEDSYTFVSSTTGSATSYGKELEVNKSVYTGDDTWATNLRVKLDEDGNMVQDTFLYRIEVRPHNGYASTIIPVSDVLPEGMDFVGFVADVSAPDKTTEGSVSMGDGLTATWLDADRTLKITGSVAKDQSLYVTFKVKVTDFEENLPIINQVETSKVTIVPSNSYPLTIAKIDARDASVVISDDTARYTVTNKTTGEVIIDDAIVRNGAIVKEDGKAITVEDPGTYVVSETVAPKGYDLTDATVDVVIGEGGQTNTATLYNTPQSLYAIGDVVWYDDDVTGTQPSDKRPVPGVTVDLLGAEGDDVIATTTTDENGAYLFDLLPEGEYRVKFTLPEDLAGAYAFSEKNAPGSTVKNDSDADPATGITDVITLNGDNEQLTSRTGVKAINGIDPTWDAGIYRVPTYAIGDYTWIDTNKDGLQGERESVIPGIIVRLLDAEGEVIDETVSDENGLYLFDELAAGDYSVEFEIPEALRATYAFTQSNVDDDAHASTDSDAVVTDTSYIARTGTITLNDDNEQITTDYADQTVTAWKGIDPTWDAGVIVKKVSVGDFVWTDLNRDGLQDEGEPGILGVVLELLGPDGEPILDEFDLPRTATTDENGAYLFTDLPALTDGQSYTVVIDPERAENVAALEGLRPTRDDQDGDKNSSTWEAASEADLTTDGASDLTLDFGFVLPTYAIGDYAWIDADRDGVQGEGEKVLSGLIVRLLNADGEVVAETTTDADGHYLFDLLEAGTYSVEFEIPEALRNTYAFTTADVEAGANADSDAIVTEDVFVARTEAITLDASNTELTLDYDAQTVAATAGIDPTWDAGVIVKVVSVGDYVWIDENKDGLQDEGEPGIPGVVLELRGPDGEAILDADGNPVITMTDDNGAYLFEGLPLLAEGESYTVVIDPAREENVTALAGLTPTRDDQEGELNSSTWQASSEAQLTTDGASDLTLDFGFTRIPSYAIGDVVWIDANKDGLQGDDEQVLAGITVRLLDAEGTTLDETVTDENGRYLFDTLAAGTYSVEFEIPEALRTTYAFTTANVEGGANADSDAIVTETSYIARTEAITLDESNTELTLDYDAQTVKALAGIDPTWDAGVIVKTVSVGDFVWIDENGNGLQDEGEPGIPGVVLELQGPDGEAVLDADGNPVTATTDENGAYLFEGLPALADGESYTVVIDPERDENVDALAGLLPTRDDQEGERNSSTWQASSEAALTTDGASDLTLDFGFIRKTYAVGDYVWIDKDGDGVQDEGDLPLAGVTVELLNTDGDVVATTTTDKNGRYLFDLLPAGSYQIRFTLTPEQEVLYVFTTATVAGATAATDSDATIGTGLTAVFVLDDTNTALTRDYTDAAFAANQGVDPTWDAGVFLKEDTLGGGEDSDVDGDTDGATDGSTDGDTDGATDGSIDGATDGSTDGATPAPSQSAPGALSVTGQTIPGLALLLALLALFAGLALVARRTLLRR